MLTYPKPVSVLAFPCVNGLTWPPHCPKPIIDCPGTALPALSFFLFSCLTSSSPPPLTVTKPALRLLQQQLICTNTAAAASAELQSCQMSDLLHGEISLYPPSKVPHFTPFGHFLQGYIHKIHDILQLCAAAASAPTSAWACLASQLG